MLDYLQYDYWELLRYDKGVVSSECVSDLTKSELLVKSESSVISYYSNVGDAYIYEELLPLISDYAAHLGFIPPKLEELGEFCTVLCNGIECFRYSFYLAELSEFPYHDLDDYELIQARQKGTGINRMFLDRVGLPQSKLQNYDYIFITKFRSFDDDEDIIERNIYNDLISARMTLISKEKKLIGNRIRYTWTADDNPIPCSIR